MERKQKILITGFNALAIGTAKSTLNIATSARILPRVLKEIGYDVVQKPITPGEDVSQYDKVIVYVFGPNSLSARFWYGAAYTLIKRPDAIVSIDDWQVKQSVSGFGTFARGHWRIWKKLSKAGNPVGKVNWEEAQPYKKEIEDLVDHYAFDTWPKLLIPAYDGGDYSTLGVKSKEIINWDPTPYTDTYLDNPDVDLFSTQSPVRVKGKHWVMASLLNKMNWLKDNNFQWEVKNFGNVKLKQERLKEHELYQEYRKAWAILSPPHYHTEKGSAWWRVRYKMASDAKNIVVAHPEEMKKLYGFSLNISDVETKDNEKLKELFNKQNDAFQNKVWTKEKTKKYFKCLLG